jgi:hypothetical protein
MSDDLYNEGFTNQINIDFSPVVIKAMQEKHKDKPGMQCMFNLCNFRITWQIRRWTCEI